MDEDISGNIGIVNSILGFWKLRCCLKRKGGSGVEQPQQILPNLLLIKKVLLFKHKHLLLCTLVFDPPPSNV